MYKAGIVTGVAVSAVVALCWGASPRVAVAASPASSPAPLTLIPACAAGAADATLSWPANTPKVSVSSPNAAYGHIGCAAYVVEVSVTPATATIASPFNGTFDLTGIDPAHQEGYTLNGLSAAQCTSYVQQMMVFRRANGQTSFTTITGGMLNGQWTPSAAPKVPATCKLVQQAGFLPGAPLTPPASGTDTYRIAIGVHMGGSALPVQAGGTHW